LRISDFSASQSRIQQLFALILLGSPSFFGIAGTLDLKEHTFHMQLEIKNIKFRFFDGFKWNHILFVVKLIYILLLLLPLTGDSVELNWSTAFLRKLSSKRRAYISFKDVSKFIFYEPIYDYVKIKLTIKEFCALTWHTTRQSRQTHENFTSMINRFKSR